MITSLTFPLYRQGNPKWAAQRLGTKNGTTIGTHGCLITCLSMASSAFGQVLNPAQVDDLFTNGKGYANQNLVIWNAIGRLLPQINHLGTDYCATTPAPIAKIRDHINIGGLCLLRVGFGGNPANEHWLLADGYNGDDIIKCDPYYGDETGFGALDSKGHYRYGQGSAVRDILEVHYLLDAMPDVPPAPIAAPPTSPVAKEPIPLPATEAPIVPPVVDPEPAAPVPGTVIEPDPTPAVEEPTAPTEPTPVPVTVIPDYVSTFTEREESQTIKREGAHAINPVDDSKVIDLPVGYVMEVAGYYVHNEEVYARSTKAVKEENYNGVHLDYFQEPAGYSNGDIPVKVVEVPAQTPAQSVPVPVPVSVKSAPTPKDVWDELAKLLVLALSFLPGFNNIHPKE